MASQNFSQGEQAHQHASARGKRGGVWADSGAGGWLQPAGWTTPPPGGRIAIFLSKPLQPVDHESASRRQGRAGRVCPSFDTEAGKVNTMGREGAKAESGDGGTRGSRGFPPPQFVTQKKMGLTELELVHTLCGKNGIVTPLPSRPQRGYSREGDLEPLQARGDEGSARPYNAAWREIRGGGDQTASPLRDAPVGRREEGRGSLLRGHLRGGEVLLAPLLRQVPDLGRD